MSSTRCCTASTISLIFCEYFGRSSISPAELRIGADADQVDSSSASVHTTKLARLRGRSKPHEKRDHRLQNERDGDGRDAR